MPDPNVPTIRQIRPRDLPAIGAYLKQHVGMMGANCDRMMAHWWEDNPAYNPKIPKGWFIEHRYKMVGILINIPSLFQFGGHPQICLNPTGWHVLPDYRGTVQARQLFHNFGEAADHTLSFITTPAENVLRFYREELCYFDFPTIAKRYHYYVFDYAKFLRFSTSKKSKILHTPLLPLYRYRQGRRLAAKKRKQHDIELINASDDADAIQALWERGRENHLHTHWRDAAALRWLMSGHRVERKSLYGCYEGSKLKAYGLFMRKQEHGHEVLECLDLFSDDHQTEPLTAILEHVIKHSNERSSAYLKVPSFHPKISAACADLKLLSRPSENHYLVRYGGAFQDRLNQQECFLTGIHGDYALY